MGGADLVSQNLKKFPSIEVKNVNAPLGELSSIVIQANRDKKFLETPDKDIIVVAISLREWTYGRVHIMQTYSCAAIRELWEPLRIYAPSKRAVYEGLNGG